MHIRPANSDEIAVINGLSSLPPQNRLDLVAEDDDQHQVGYLVASYDIPAQAALIEDVQADDVDVRQALVAHASAALNNMDCYLPGTAPVATDMAAPAPADAVTPPANDTAWVDESIRDNFSEIA